MSSKQATKVNNTSEESQTTLNSIFVKGARMHNLKNIDVHFPRNKFIVITGVSGSGKSSLAIDTLFAEGQRRYAESLSSYARQFLNRMDKPDVDFIQGICPAIAIEQKVSSHNTRSNVGSLTEISDYLRLLFARIGRTYSPISGKEVKRDKVSDVVDYIKHLIDGTRVHIIIPFTTNYGRSVHHELEILMQKGFTRLLVLDAELKQHIERIEDFLLNSTQTLIQEQEKLYLLIDRLITKKFEEDELHRLADSIQTAYYESNGACFLLINNEKIIQFNNRFEADGILFEEPTPNLFSSNNPQGACPTCEGFGMVLGIDEDLVIPNKNLSVYEGAVACWHGAKMSEWQQDFINKSVEFCFPIHRSIAKLTKEEFYLLWNGNDKVKGVTSFFSMVEQNLYKIQYRILQARFKGKTTCPSCHGNKLKESTQYVKINQMDIATLYAMPIEKVFKWLQGLILDDRDSVIAKRILIELSQRLQTLVDVGLPYLTLNRAANTLSGGESQRIQLTRFLGSNLSDSLYILDEPSIGLHPRDTEKLIHVLKRLRDLSNTVLVVEHDSMMMKLSDYIIDMGPLASHLGGEVIAAGTYTDIINNKNSLTGQYLSGALSIAKKVQFRKPLGSITLKGCSQNNLKEIDVKFPLGVLCVVTGVSGSGKTTLVKQILYPALLNSLGDLSVKPGQFLEMIGDFKKVKHVELIDQNPIGKSSRSNPVTYIKAWDEIRKLLSKQPLSKIRGFAEKHFSFNTDDGRCDNCKGDGEITIQMQFLADTHLVCESCKGKRFKDIVLEVTYKNKNVFDILELSVDEALNFFNDETKIKEALYPLSKVGLGYIKLGQSSSTLSGGEAQRVKLASFLGKSAHKESSLFIFDEPTTGLHIHDISKLLVSINALIEKGHSVIIIEHNVEVISQADWVVDLGVEGGEGGGNLLYEGVPSGLKDVENSYTGKYI